MEDYPKEAYREGDYILNHYDRNSHADKIILARNLHRWAIKYSAQQSVHLTALRRAFLGGLLVAWISVFSILAIIGGR